MPSEDPSDTVNGILASGRNIRLGRGVVAKTSYIAAITVLVWGMVAWKWSENLVMDAGLLMLGLITTCFTMWFIKGTQSFAERNPAQAMLEGAELLEWHKMEVQAKGSPPVRNPPLIEYHSVPQDLIEGQNGK